MTTFVRTVFAACLSLGLSASFAAAQDQDVEGSKDHPLISRYPGSIIKNYVTKEFDEATLPLGKSTDQGFAKSQHVEGKVTRIVYTAPQGRSLLEVFRNYQGALKKAGFETPLCLRPAGLRRVGELECKGVRQRRVRRLLGTRPRDSIRFGEARAPGGRRLREFAD